MYYCVLICFSVYCRVLLCITVYCSVLLCIARVTVYLFVLLCLVCIAMYCFVILCIALHSSILLFVVLGKLAGYDSVGGRGITNHMGAPEWSNQTYLTL